MRSFLSGLIVGGVLLVVSLFLDDSTKMQYLLFSLGIIPMIISGFLSGVFVSGDRVRANQSDDEDFREKTKISSALFLFGIPCLLAGIAIHII